MTTPQIICKMETLSDKAWELDKKIFRRMTRGNYNNQHLIQERDALKASIATLDALIG